MTELRGFRHVALTVTDCDASAEWYQSVLGFEELFREANDERRACVMRFPRGAFGVGVVEHVASADAPFDPSHRGLDHVAFSVGSLEELEQWAQRLSDS